MRKLIVLINNSRGNILCRFVSRRPKLNLEGRDYKLRFVELNDTLSLRNTCPQEK